MSEGLRGDNRNDPIAGAVAANPGIKAVLDQRRVSKVEAMQQAVCDAIQATDDRKLCAWVAVAVWENEDGTTSHSLIGDDQSSPLEHKGYLHDGIWVAAHSM